MQVENIRHKALRRLAAKGDRRILEAGRLIDMLTFIDAAATFDDLFMPPNFGFHALTGERSGSFAMTVTKNWRLTFVKISDQAIGDLDLEDYH
ncbi:MAG: type II toxin-antitoxin system RelE/ParE family toxin [Sphingomicrobium sp.]